MDSTAGIVIIGDEILSGKFADENASFLIGELRALGVRLQRITIIPDHVATIADTVSRLANEVDHVFTSGGVGPTHDDVTMAAIAAGFGVSVERSPELVAILQRHYGESLAEGHLRLAEVPAGSILITGDEPSWPVVCFRNVYILPGVPSLFARKFRSIAERFRRPPFHTARIYTLGDEATIADTLTRTVRAHPDVQFGSYPRFDETEYRILITIESKDRDHVAAACAELAAALAEIVVKVEPPAP